MIFWWFTIKSKCGLVKHKENL